MEFGKILNVYQDDLKKTEDIIKLHCRGKSSLIEEIAGYITSSGGKKIRPLLVIICAKLINPKVDYYHNLCAAVELIHTATLLHDDVIDNSELRRGKKTANSVWDNKASILVGDFLFSLSFQLMTKTKSMEVLDILSTASNSIADGEVNQLENSKNLTITVDKYFEIIEGKTSALFASSCSSGAALAGATKDQESLLYEYGNHLGSLFQIIDDIIDYTSDTKNLGKSAGDDFFEAKVTLPIILCRDLAVSEDRQEVDSLFEKAQDGEANQEDFKSLLTILNKYNSFERSFEIANQQYAKIAKLLSVLTESAEKEYLLEIADFALKRTK